uniref:Uncharacterized protein n=1 Tax=Oryza punctata TaxID=4537 RepID=A0A0E0L548_ORYPU
MAACMKELSSSSSTTPRRSVDRLAVEFIDTNSSNHINRLITTGVDAWCVEHLDVAAAPLVLDDGNLRIRFPHDLPKLETLVSVQNSVELYYPDASPAPALPSTSASRKGTACCCHCWRGSSARARLLL